MDRRRVATVLAVVVTLAILMWAVRGRRQQVPPPEDVVWELVAASQAGDVERYLGCFNGRLQDQLSATVAELPGEGFSDYLRSSSQLLTGVAVYDVERPQPGRATLTVEYVYRDATERQRMELELKRGAWSISDLERSKRAKPLIPYGAPAAPMPEPLDDTAPDQPSEPGVTEGNPP
jgi:hypothetical protein